MYTSTITHFAEVAQEKVTALRRSRGGFFVGAMLAGAYIGIAMILALSTASGLPAGARPLVMGGVFGVGLILTVFAGAELFTGYAMYMGYGLVRKSVGLADTIVVMVTVWLGNLAGALLLSLLFAAGDGGTVFANGAGALNAYVTHKVHGTTVELLARAALCNWLVCLSIWTSTRVQGDTAKCIVLAWVLLAFVASGFEHSVANMTCLTLGLLAPDSAIEFAGAVRNLALVTVGNLAGGFLFVVGAYSLAARTDLDGPARHDTGLLPTSGLRTASSTTPSLPTSSAAAKQQA
jgi:nitrite transporter